MRAIVVGGGIGGLAAALALRRAGNEIEVFERAPELREIGAGLTLWSNATRCLSRLALDDRVRAVSCEIDTLESRSWRGSRLQRVPIGRLASRLNSPCVGIHRRDLLAVLGEAVGGSAVRFGKECVGAAAVPEGAVARFSDGTEAEGDILVGADGVFSAVRAALAGDQPRYAGHVCWRGVVGLRSRWRLPENVSWFGPGRHVGTVRIPGDRVFWYATKNLPAEHPPAPDVSREVTEAFADWADPVPEIFSATPREEIIRNRLYDRPLAWGSARITLLGDAAHPMRPTLGQGACQAIEDALVLADTMRMSDDPSEALRFYERMRSGRARRVVRHSLLLSTLEQVEGRTASALRNAWLRLTPGRMSLPWFSTFLSSRDASGTRFLKR